MVRIVLLMFLILVMDIVALKVRMIFVLLLKDFSTGGVCLLFLVLMLLRLIGLRNLMSTVGLLFDLGGLL